MNKCPHCANKIKLYLSKETIWLRYLWKNNFKFILSNNLQKSHTIDTTSFKYWIVNYLHLANNNTDTRIKALIDKDTRLNTDTKSDTKYRYMSKYSKRYSYSLHPKTPTYFKLIQISDIS